MKEFDYYIYIDYSEGLIGYTIIEKSKIKEILPKISRFRHYKESKYKQLYLKWVKQTFDRENLLKLLFKWKIRETRENTEIYSDILEFIQKNDNCIIFISIDNNQYKSFMKLFGIIPHKKHVEISNESCLKKDSIECKLSYIIDNLLNLKRTRGKLSIE